MGGGAGGGGGLRGCQNDCLKTCFFDAYRRPRGRGQTMAGPELREESPGERVCGVSYAPVPQITSFPLAPVPGSWE